MGEWVSGRIRRLTLTPTGHGRKDAPNPQFSPYHAFPISHACLVSWLIGSFDEHSKMAIFGLKEKEKEKEKLRERKIEREEQKKYARIHNPFNAIIRKIQE